MANASVRKAAQPCPVCGNCTAVDPHCTAWASALMTAHPLTNICPPGLPPEEHTSNTTFSCLADAAWMYLTAAFALLWVLLLLRPLNPGTAKSKVENGGGGAEMGRPAVA